MTVIVTYFLPSRDSEKEDAYKDVESVEWDDYDDSVIIKTPNRTVTYRTKYIIKITEYAE